MKEETKNLPADTSRRDFIKNSTVAAASFMIVPRYVLGGKGFIAPSDKLVAATVLFFIKSRLDVSAGKFLVSSFISQLVN